MRSGPGRSVALAVGGAAESLLAAPGSSDLVSGEEGQAGMPTGHDPCSSGCRLVGCFAEEEEHEALPPSLQPRNVLSWTAAVGGQGSNEVR